MKTYNKHIKTGLILLGMIAVFLLIAWGVCDGWIVYPLGLAGAAALLWYIWVVADEFRKTFFNND